MGTSKSIILIRIAITLAVTLLLGATHYSQDLPSRLAQPTTYSPKSVTALEQLIEVAQYYRIPMGIEWISDPNAGEIPLSSPANPVTVQDLILIILQRSHGYVAQQRDGVLHIAKPEFLSNSENFLSLRISKFDVQNDNVFGAQALLRRTIRMTLHPERYGRGFNEGYGWGVPRDDGFDKENITFAGRDLTVREILNKIAAGNGNALWVVKLLPSQRMSREPFFAQVSLIDGRPTPDFDWKFIPLGSVNARTKSPN